jgi:hypothetical protein
MSSTELSAGSRTYSERQRRFDVHLALVRSGELGDGEDARTAGVLQLLSAGAWDDRGSASSANRRKT